MLLKKEAEDKNTPNSFTKKDIEKVSVSETQRKNGITGNYFRCMMIKHGGKPEWLCGLPGLWPQKLPKERFGKTLLLRKVRKDCNSKPLETLFGRVLFLGYTKQPVRYFLQTQP